MDEFVIYNESLCFASVCSSLPQPKVEAKMAAELCGTKIGWTFDAEPFKGGEPNPCPCNQKPDTHKHYLFVA